MKGFLSLTDPAALDPKLVGGKAAALSHLLQLGYRVPDGFVLPAAMLRKASPTERRQAIEQAVSMLEERYDLRGCAFAVRSSGIDEDGAAASFAGQYETFLNVAGTKAIASAVERCWESAVSQRATAYRRQQGVSAGENQLAVLVQQFVAADVSAVLFSANPINGRREEILVNASWALGESIVGGTVTPDSFLLRRPELSLIGRHIAGRLPR